MSFKITDTIEAKIKIKMEKLDKWREQYADTINSKKDLNDSSDEFVELYKAKRKEYLELSSQLQSILTQRLR
jgi:hypothetical protein